MTSYRWLRAPYHKGVIFQLACSVKHPIRPHLSPHQPQNISCKPQVLFHYNRTDFLMSLSKYISSSRNGAKIRRNGKGYCRKCRYNIKVWSKVYDYLNKKRRCLNFLRKTLSTLTCTTTKSLMQPWKLIRAPRKLKMSSINLKRLSRWPNPMKST